MERKFNITDSDYVTRDVAELLQKLGYECEDELSRRGYYLDSDTLSCEDSDSIHYDTFILAPLLFEVQKWLRDVHQFDVSAGLCGNSSDDADGREVESWVFWSWEIRPTTDVHVFKSEEFDEYTSYEEALNAGIRAMLKQLEEWDSSSCNNFIETN